MNRYELKQLRHLNHEVNMIQEQINQMQYESAAITASDREHPYCQHVEIIGGLPSQDDQIKRRQLEVRKSRCQERILQIEGFIYGVEDSLIRQLLVYRYVEGLRWEETAARMGNGYSKEQLKKQLQRFLNKL